jgi:hypothetical protein
VIYDANKRGDPVGFWEELKSIGRDLNENVVKPGMVVHNLLQMNESSGMTHLSVLVPQLAEDGMLDQVIDALWTVARNQDADDDMRQKARAYASHAQALARNL